MIGCLGVLPLVSMNDTQSCACINTSEHMWTPKRKAGPQLAKVLASYTCSFSIQNKVKLIF